MRGRQHLVALLLLAAAASAAANTLETAAAKQDGDEEGVYYQSHLVSDYTNAMPLKGKFVQSAYTTCPAPYDSFSFVTKIKVCKDKDGFITGLKYFSEHPTRHHDPVTVCDVVGRALECETIKLYSEDWQWKRFNVITNIRVAKAKDVGGRWRIIYIAFSFSNGDAIEFGKYPEKHGKKGSHDLKYEQWFQKPNPGQVCGMNGITSQAAMCDSKSGYLQWVKPCGKCIHKPKNFKCDTDVCLKNKKSYKGGYKGDFAKDGGMSLYKDELKKPAADSYSEEPDIYDEQPMQ